MDEAFSKSDKASFKYTAGSYDEAKSLYSQAVAKAKEAQRVAEEALALAQTPVEPLFPSTEERVSREQVIAKYKEIAALYDVARTDIDADEALLAMALDRITTAKELIEKGDYNNADSELEQARPLLQ